MWAILMIVLFFSAFAGIIYLINRIGKFGFLNKITKGKKWLRILISAVLVCGIIVILWVAWGSMNAIVCILHLIIFWLISDGIFALIKKTPEEIFEKILCRSCGTCIYHRISWKRLVSGTSCMGDGLSDSDG